MRTKSFPVRSLRKSRDPYPSLPERFGRGEIVRDTCGEGDKNRRHCGLGTDRGEPLRCDACVVCEISDEWVSPCSGIDCRVAFHGECLTPEFGGSEDLSNPFCPYCWFKIVALKSKSLRDKAIGAEKAVLEYLDKNIAGDQGENADGNVAMDATDSETSTTKERNGDHVAEQRKRSAATKVAAKSKTLRDVSFFNKDQRRRLLWTSEEEEMLKVGVEKFAAEAKRNMPWRKILEMGEKVFHQTRSPADLKDKWRNMLKSSSH